MGQLRAQRGFRLQAVRPLRTAPLRFGHIRNRWATTADFTLAKSFDLWGERLRAQFRAEAFNVFNTPNFSGNPNLTPTSPTFGAILRHNGQTNEPRVVQLGLRIHF